VDGRIVVVAVGRNGMCRSGLRGRRRGRRRGCGLI